VTNRVIDQVTDRIRRRSGDNRTAYLERALINVGLVALERRAFRWHAVRTEASA
jgi:hypothetical protein